MLVAYDFKGNFTYILTSFKGLAHDRRVLTAARENEGLPMPEGYYYLGDARYSSKTYLIVLY